VATAQRAKFNEPKKYSMTETRKKNITISELSSKTVSWYYGGECHEIKNDNELLALLLNNKNYIAIIENLYGDISENKACIVNGNNEKIWDISLKLKFSHKKFIENRNVIFYDIYYIGETLYFFVNIHNTDWRFSFNPDNGEIGDLIESR
jgi:hypothetical protein